MLNVLFGSDVPVVYFELFNFQVIPLAVVTV